MMLVSMVLGVWRTSRRLTLGSLGLMLTGSASGPLAALGLARVVDAAYRGETTRATLYGLLVGVLVLCQITMEHWSHFLYFRLAKYYELGRNDELIRLANESTGLAQHERPDYADKVELLRSESFVLWRAAQQLVYASGLILQMALTALLLANVNPVLLLLPLFAIPPLVGGRLAIAAFDRASVAVAEQRRQAGDIVDLALSAPAGREIRLFGLEHELRRRQSELWNVVERRLWRAQITSAAWTFGSQLVFVAGYVGAVLLVVREAVQGRRTVGDVVLVITLAAQVSQQVASGLDIVFNLQRAAKALGRMAWLRNLVAELEPELRDELPVPASLTGGIVCEDLSFTYPGTDEEVLRGVDLELPPGSIVAIVGENGAGKSTLVKLLCRFYEPTAGRILVDGAELQRLDPRAWRKRIAAAFQDYARFELRARECVGVGDLTRIDDAARVTQALAGAQADELVLGLPAGLETELGRSYADGVELSGGEWQKLALARALMRERPLLLILDEPTSALDPSAEHALFERYAASARAAATGTGAVTIFVSHRFSTVRVADLILVMRDGTIAERGSHEELMALGGTYAELFELQAAAYR